ncbi:Uu.00g033310.m01.CDS01 [Anthostomella pinea]|uniref:Uu.00g033310.m01.CDS01 n=1 Tax=Anthostomella pinea TaxID=933095 RepID=A0AAI8YDD9_9PEZI|nr:Uu.00g033310.m01.CDS01 [Anthostomella pinea]
MPQHSNKPRPGALRRIFSSSSSRRMSSEELQATPRMAQNPAQVQAAMLTGADKLAAVTSLIDRLSQDLTDVNLLPHQRDAALEELKIFGRDPRNSDPIFTKKGIETLTRHSFDSPSSTTSRNALRCLCNALLLNQDARQTFVDLGYEAKACSKLKNDSRDNEFLVSRILFLITYGTNADLVELIEKHHLADCIAKNLERHAKNHLAGRPTDPMEDMALTETLKLLFNITHWCKDRTSSFTQTVPHIATLLCKGSFQPQPEKPLDAPIGHLVNALLNLDLGAKEIHTSLYPQAEPKEVAERLIQLLDQSRGAYKNEDLESSVTPLLGVIRAIHEYAPEDVRTYIREKLLPTEADRNEVLGRTDSLPSWLLQNSTNPVTPELRNTISDLLFDMSDKDASKFVENVGYGFASGFLFSRNIPVPQNASEAFSNVPGGANRAINPVTGQFLDSERQPEEPEMTEAEKEREAERLFVLFERLRANGIISAENPVRTAVQEGRFEELPDDYEEGKD